MPTGAYILGCAGPELSADERSFFRAVDPWGFILFARNVEAPDQLRRLTGDLRAAVGREAPILIDQEGGRVARMTAPAWRTWEPPLDEMTQRGAVGMRLRYRIIAAELRDVGIDVNCVPCADIATAETHPFLRNRCYGADPENVTAGAEAVAEGLMAGGVLPVMKHMPGHGRAVADSHVALPDVTTDLETLLETDFAPFRALSGLPMAMTAHVVFSRIDPTQPATTSRDMIRIMREEIGFEGLLMTDDISMQALQGGLGDRAAAALAAGCDLVVHCNGEMAEMEEIVARSGPMSEAAVARADRALTLRTTPGSVDIAQLDAMLADLGRERSNA